ncbi:hypothetical protein GLOIN_2v1805909 [Rhizophagus clarus]|uniref:Uncharacterized protein n=1 Tax=Rhizophagus clarus TaxID=94130 RepID=A0A8H3M2S6_9GLOM|nr:hypothetical protein GLOIN_2v1805909 [Rhizophagus clarus]
MARFTCPYIKKNGIVCENRSCCPTGCYRHWHLYEKNMKKRPCLVCGFPTDNDSGCCSKHSAKFYAYNYQMRQKYKAEILQLAKTSELYAEE